MSSAKRSAGHDLTWTLASPPAKTAAKAPPDSPYPAKTAFAARTASGVVSTKGRVLGRTLPITCSANRCWLETSVSSLTALTVSANARVGSMPRSSLSDAAKIGSTSALPRTMLFADPNWDATPISSQVLLSVGARIRSGARAAKSLTRVDRASRHSEGRCLKGLIRATFHSTPLGNRGARLS